MENVSQVSENIKGTEKFVIRNAMAASPVSINSVYISLKKSLGRK
jgi:hypothetical protein